MASHLVDKGKGKEKMTIEDEDGSDEEGSDKEGSNLVVSNIVGKGKKYPLPTFTETCSSSTGGVIKFQSRWDRPKPHFRFAFPIQKKIADRPNESTVLEMIDLTHYYPPVDPGGDEFILIGVHCPDMAKVPKGKTVVISETQTIWPVFIKVGAGQNTHTGFVELGSSEEDSLPTAYKLTQDDTYYFDEIGRNYPNASNERATTKPNIVKEYNRHIAQIIAEEQSARTPNKIQSESTAIDQSTTLNPSSRRRKSKKEDGNHSNLDTISYLGNRIARTAIALSSQRSPELIQMLENLQTDIMRFLPPGLVSAQQSPLLVRQFLNHEELRDEDYAEFLSAEDVAQYEGSGEVKKIVTLTEYALCRLVAKHALENWSINSQIDNVVSLRQVLLKNKLCIPTEALKSVLVLTAAHPGTDTEVFEPLRMWQDAVLIHGVYQKPDINVETDKAVLLLKTLGEGVEEVATTLLRLTDTLTAKAGATSPSGDWTVVWRRYASKADQDSAKLMLAEIVAWIAEKVREDLTPATKALEDMSRIVREVTGEQ